MRARHPGCIRRSVRGIADAHPRDTRHSPAPAGHPNTAWPSPHPSKKQGGQTRSSTGHWESPDSTSTGCGQAVNFQEVVHSALIVNAEVAKKPAIRGEPNGHPQECSSDAERARGHGAQCDGKRTEQGRRGAPVQYPAKTVAKWVERFR